MKKLEKGKESNNTNKSVVRKQLANITKLDGWGLTQKLNEIPQKNYHQKHIGY